MKKNTQKVSQSFLDDQLISVTILNRMNITSQLKSTPHTGASDTGKLELPCSKVMFFLERLIQKPWIEHLIFSALISAPLRSPTSQMQVIKSMHEFFEQVWILHKGEDIYDSEFYIREDVVNNTFTRILSDKYKASVDKKSRLVINYGSVVKMIASWMKLHKPYLGLDRHYYEQFTLGHANRAISHIATQMCKRLQAKYQLNRKRKTDEVMPDFQKIFRESKTRLSRFENFYKAVTKALEIATKEKLLTLSFAFNDEDTTIHCELQHTSHILDVLLSANFELPRDIIKDLSKSKLDDTVYSEGYYFVKILNADELSLSKFWFVELCNAGMLYRESSHNREQRNQCYNKYKYSEYYFYNSTLATRLLDEVAPRLADVASQCLKTPFIDPHSYRLIFHFAALAIDLLSTTGMRVNELMQIAASEDCLTVLEIQSSDAASSYKHVAMLIPKGTDQPEPFFFAKSTFDLLVDTMEVMASINKLVSGNPIIDTLPPHKDNKKVFLMHPAPYIFQLNGKHMVASELMNAVKLLLHGIELTNCSENNGPTYLTLYAHIFRHCFATFAVQVENIPIDVVAKLLKHKDIKTTSYYSAPTTSMIAETQSAFVAAISKPFNLDKAFAKKSKKDQKLYAEIKKKSGSLSKIVGGTCISHGFCHKTESCIGCPSKIPDSSHKDIVTRQLERAKIDYENFERDGYLAEALRLENFIKSCERELEQMEFQERDREYRAIPLSIQISNDGGTSPGGVHVDL